MRPTFYVRPASARMIHATRTPVIVALALACAAGQVLAQAGPSALALTGQLYDGDLDEPLGFANVAVYTPGDSLVGGSTTDIDGRYTVALPAPGEYVLRASFIGYADATQALTVAPGAGAVSVPTLRLAAGGEVLTEAVVTAERALMELGLDRKVFNVESNIAAAGGSATDLLRNLPSVGVDLDGNVSLRGSGNVRFLINGRPSGLTAGDPATFLASLSASAIERIEVITNPGAAFDPEGTAGVINIVLKQERRDGLNGSVVANVGTRDKYDANLSLNYRLGAWNHFVGVGGRDDRRAVEGDRQQVATAGEAFRRDNVFGGFRQDRGITLRAGSELAFGTRGSLQVAGTYQYGDGPSASGRFTRFFDASDALYLVSDRTERETEREREYELRADYRQALAGEGHRLGGALVYGRSAEREVENFDEALTDAAGAAVDRLRQNAPVDEARDNLLAQLDYERALGPVALTAGWRSTLQRLRTDAVFNRYDRADDSFAKVDSLSNVFDYDEDVHAVYATAGAEPGRWRLSGGLRAEQAFTTSAVRAPVEQAATFRNDYLELYPSAFAGYEVSERAMVQVSYSRRVNRPRSRQLNPFVDRGDPNNLRGGNPFLLPEFISSYEANYQQRLGPATLTTGLYWREKRDLISRVTETLPGGVALSTNANLAEGRDLGAELIATYQAGERWRFMLSGNAYRTSIRGQLAEGAVDVAGGLFDGRAQVNAELPWGLDAQATYFYRSGGVTAQGTSRAVHHLDLGLRRDVLRGRGAVTLRVSDLFDTREYRFTNDVGGLATTTRYKRESQIAYLGFQYRFGIDGEKRRGGRDDDFGGERGGGGGGDDF